MSKQTENKILKAMLEAVDQKNYANSGKSSKAISRLSKKNLAFVVQGLETYAKSLGKRVDQLTSADIRKGLTPGKSSYQLLTYFAAAGIPLANGETENAQATGRIRSSLVKKYSKRGQGGVSPELADYLMFASAFLNDLETTQATYDYFSQNWEAGVDGSDILDLEDGILPEEELHQVKDARVFTAGRLNTPEKEASATDMYSKLFDMLSEGASIMLSINLMLGASGGAGSRFKAGGKEKPSLDIREILPEAPEAWVKVENHIKRMKALGATANDITPTNILEGWKSPTGEFVEGMMKNAKDGKKRAQAELEKAMKKILSDEAQESLEQADEDHLGGPAIIKAFLRNPKSLDMEERVELARNVIKQNVKLKTILSKRLMKGYSLNGFADKLALASTSDVGAKVMKALILSVILKPLIKTQSRQQRDEYAALVKAIKKVKI